MQTPLVRPFREGSTARARPAPLCGSVWSCFPAFAPRRYGREAAGDEKSASGIADHYGDILRGTSLRARWIRYWFAPDRVLFLNTPIRRFLRTVPIAQDSWVLDVGCGSGGLLLYLQKTARLRHRMEGVDASPAMVAWARREIRRQRSGRLINIRLGSGTALPYAASQFDLVFSTYVIKHLSDAELDLMLSEVTRVLRPGGSFCIWEAGPTRPMVLDKLNRRLISGGLLSIRIRSSDTLKSMLLDHGFRITRPFGHAPYLYHPAMRRIGFVCTR